MASPNFWNRTLSRVRNWKGEDVTPVGPVPVSEDLPEKELPLIRRQIDACLEQGGQVIGLTLTFSQILRERGNNASGQRNVADADAGASGGGKSLDHRQERGRGQFGGFVNLGVNDVGGALISHV